VALPAGELGEACLDEVQRRFEARYLALYGRTVPGVGLEVVNWRVVVEGPRPSVRISPDTPTETAVEKALKGTRPAYLSEDGSFIEVPVFDRRKLPARAVLHGPAIIEERESTLVFGPRASAKVDPMLSVVVSLQAREKRELGGLGLRSCDDC
jgi:N-methylhydantoinase A